MKLFRQLCLFACIIALAGCQEQAKELYVGPSLSAAPVPLGGPDLKSYAAPEPQSDRYSVWRTSAAGLYTARRAMAPGDIVTVRISINDSAQLRNRTGRTRTSGRDFGFNGSIGLGGLNGSGAADADLESGTEFAGRGDTVRAESIDLKIAATVIERYPNGNLRIHGTQEILVTNEKRILAVDGVVRASEIEPDNSIPYEKVADARIAYVGQGRISDVQRPPYGQQTLDLLLPF